MSDAGDQGFMNAEQLQEWASKLSEAELEKWRRFNGWPPKEDDWTHPLIREDRPE